MKPEQLEALENPKEALTEAETTELKVETAVHLYAQGRLSLGKARELAGLTLWEFRQLLASRRIPTHYDEADLDEECGHVARDGPACGYSAIGRVGGGVPPWRHGLRAGLPPLAA
jgi:predicted HTH domain antitoxin